MRRPGTVTVRLGTLVGQHGSWRLHFRAWPGWWIYSDRNRCERKALAGRQ